MAIVAGFVNLPAFGVCPRASSCGSSTTSSRSAPYFPDDRPPRVHAGGSPSLSGALGLVGIGLAYAYYWFQGRFHGVTERNRVARGRPHGARQQVLLRPPLHRRHRRRHQGPGRPGGLLVQPERPRRHRQRRRPPSPSASARWTYKYIDQGVVDGTVNGSGCASEAFGQALRQLQTGKVQQYGALLFGGAVVLAGIFVFAI